MDKWLVRVSMPFDRDVLEFSVGKRDEKGCLYVAQPMIFKKIEEGSIIHPTLQIPSYSSNEAQDFLRQLLNEIKRNGLELNLEVEGELKATKVHLEDMRSLVFAIRKDVKSENTSTRP